MSNSKSKGLRREGGGTQLATKTTQNKFERKKWASLGFVLTPVQRKVSRSLFFPAVHSTHWASFKGRPAFRRQPKSRDGATLCSAPSFGSHAEQFLLHVRDPTSSLTQRSPGGRAIKITESLDGLNTASNEAKGPAADATYQRQSKCQRRKEPVGQRHFWLFPRDL